MGSLRTIVAHGNECYLSVSANRETSAEIDAGCYMRRRDFLSSSVALMAATGLARSRFARAAESADVPAVSRTGSAIILKAADIDEFRAHQRGPVLTRASEGYDVARRVWNGAFDRHPALIARCSSAADVIGAVQFAASHDLLVAVRGGGHSLPGYSVCEGGIMIDLAPMQGVRVDPRTRGVRAEPGVLLGALDRETQAFGLVVPAGTVSHTGVAGLTLGGGVGRLQRKFGLTVDCMIGADVVTADGKLVQASTERESRSALGIAGRRRQLRRRDFVRIPRARVRPHRHRRRHRVSDRTGAPRARRIRRLLRYRE